MTSAVAISVFDGTQSVSTDAPPRPSQSTTVTSAPAWAATSAASYPPGPPPMITIRVTSPIVPHPPGGPSPGHLVRPVCPDRTVRARRSRTLSGMSLYAAYAGNLDARLMIRRAPHSPLRGTGWLDGWRLTFGGEQMGWEGALATLVEDPFHQVFVGLYDIAARDEESLDRWEGIPLSIYRRTTGPRPHPRRGHRRLDLRTQRLRGRSPLRALPRRDRRRRGIRGRTPRLRHGTAQTALLIRHCPSTGHSPSFAPAPLPSGLGSFFSGCSFLVRLAGFPGFPGFSGSVFSGFSGCSFFSGSLFLLRCSFLCGCFSLVGGGVGWVLVDYVFTSPASGDMPCLV